MAAGHLYASFNTYPSIPIAEGRVYGLEAQTGALAWTYATEDAMNSYPRVAGGLVYLSSEGGVYALDALSGVLRWRAAAGSWIRSAPVVVDGVLYAGSWRRAYALEAATGALK